MQNYCKHQNVHCTVKSCLFSVIFKLLVFHSQLQHIFFRLCNTFFFLIHRLSKCQCNFVVHKAAATASEADLMSLRLIGKEKMRKSLLVFTPGSMRDPPNAAWRDDFWGKRKEKTNQCDFTNWDFFNALDGWSIYSKPKVMQI